MHASEKVFAIPEILELILIHLDTYELYSLQRTNGSFRQVISGSHVIRRKMLLMPTEDALPVTVNPLLPGERRMRVLPQQLLEYWSSRLRLVTPAVCLYFLPSGNDGIRPLGFWIVYTYSALREMRRVPRNGTWRNMVVMNRPGTIAVWVGPNAYDRWSIEGGRQWTMGELMDHIWTKGEAMMVQIETRTKEIAVEKDYAATRRNQIQHSDCVCM